MKSIIKHFNEQLNKSDDNRFKNWANYRAEVTNFIKRNFENKIYENILIIGAGNCDDLDIKSISKHSKTNTLMDIDISAMEKAIQKHKVENNNVYIKAVDFTGLEYSTEWNNFVNIVKPFKTKNEIDQFISKIANQIKLHDFSDNLIYDIVIVSPIYTQLLLPQVTQFLELIKSFDYENDLAEYFETVLMDLVAYSIEIFNQNILKMINNKTIVFVMADIFETWENTDFYKKIKSLESHLDYQDFHNEYLRKYGPGASDFGLSNLSESLQIIDNIWLEWPFDLQKKLFVKISKLKR